MIERTLRERFGFSGLKPGQREVMAFSLAGQSAAAIFPTGSGKSLCYQLPALHLPHLTLVVSPLLALIQDQLDFLRSKGVAAARIDSSLDRRAEGEVMAAVKTGTLKLLMISVERFKNERFRHFLAEVPVSMMVVDEAHCISEWGHNFRPDYLKLPAYRREFKIPQVLLLTATATPAVIDDMCAKFEFPRGNAVVTGFYRPNLHLNVLPVDEAKKLDTLRHQLSQDPTLPTIVYVTLQKTTEEVAAYLSSQGVPAVAYHAGMEHEDRKRIQDAFMGGAANVIVATIAFGMGIDKRDIRRVVHFDLPKSLESYSQEVGRAGRDGLDSQCVVMANLDNVGVLENFVYGDTPELHGIQTLLGSIPRRHGKWEFELLSLSNQTNIRQLPLKTLLVHLELKGVLRPLHSYFSEYKYRNLVSDEQIAATYQGERRVFVDAIFANSSKSRVWTTVNFETVAKSYPQAGRDRVVAALEYFETLGQVQLQTTGMTEVCEVTDPDFDPDALARELHEFFKHKEGVEIARINRMLAFFGGDVCLSRSLAAYFGEELPWERCERCSVCLGGKIEIRHTAALAPLESFDLPRLLGALESRLGWRPSAELATRFLCGVTAPVFIKIKAKSLPGFGVLERHRYQDTLAAVRGLGL